MQLPVYSEFKVETNNTINKFNLYSCLLDEGINDRHIRLDQIKNRLTYLHNLSSSLHDEMEQFYFASNDDQFQKLAEKISILHNELETNAKNWLSGIPAEKLSPKEKELKRLYNIVAAGMQMRLRWAIESIKGPDQGPNARQLLIETHKSNGGRLTNEQVKEIAEKHSFSLKYIQNLYREIREDIK